MKGPYGVENVPEKHAWTHIFQLRKTPLVELIIKKSIINTLKTGGKMNWLLYIPQVWTS